MECCTFHGVRDIRLSHHVHLRQVWCVIMVVSFLAALNGCYSIIMEYVERPVVVSYFIEESSSLPLPDIVVCPLNRYNATYLKSLNISFDLSQYLELAYPSPLVHSFQLRHYPRIIKQIEKLDAEMNELLRVIGNQTFTQFVKDSAIDCSAFFEDTNICNNLTEIMTSAGKCFRIRGIEQQGEGYGQGMRLVIKLPHHLYNPGVNQILNYGFVIKLAERDRGIDNDITFIPAGVHAILPLTATRYEFKDDPPRYSCDKDVDNTYSRVWCFEVCITERAEQQCNCSLAAASRLRHPKICTALEYFTCFAPAIFGDLGLDPELSQMCKSRCKPPCQYWQYTKAPSFAPFHMEQAKYFVQSDEELEELKHTVLLEVFYTTLDHTYIKHVDAVTANTLAAQLGGQFSLWVGGSIISVIQVILYFSVASIVTSWRKLCRKKANVPHPRWNAVLLKRMPKHAPM
jgi:hypothetical protein